MSYCNFTSRKSTPTCAQSCIYIYVYICVSVYQIFIKVAKGWRETKTQIGAVLISVQLFSTPWTVAPQAPLSMRFPMQEYWNGLPFPPLGDLPKSGIKPRFPALQEDSLPSELPGKDFI